MQDRKRIRPQLKKFTTARLNAPDKKPDDDLNLTRRTFMP